MPDGEFWGPRRLVGGIDIDKWDYKFISLIYPKLKPRTRSSGAKTAKKKATKSMPGAGPLASDEPGGSGGAPTCSAGVWRNRQSTRLRSVGAMLRAPAESCVVFDRSR